jgi:hypothetical protein
MQEFHMRYGDGRGLERHHVNFASHEAIEAILLRAMVQRPAGDAEAE